MLRVVTIGYKAILPAMAAVFSHTAMAAVFSNRSEPATEADQADQAAGIEGEIDMRRPAPLAQPGRTTRLLYSLVGGQRGRSRLGAPRRSVDRSFQEYSPSGFDW